MKSLIKLVIVLSITSSMDFALADYDLFLKNNCAACHYVDKRKYGPMLKEVAVKYADDPGAEAMLAKKIKAGGAGVWGEDMMPPQAQVSDADAKALAKYILSLK